MDEYTVRATAFAMPLTSPAYPVGPYRFIDREYLIITYRTAPRNLRAVVSRLSAINDKAAATHAKPRPSNSITIVIHGDSRKGGYRMTRRWGYARSTFATKGVRRWYQTSNANSGSIPGC